MNLTPQEQEALEVFQELREALFNSMFSNISGPELTYLMGMIRTIIVRLEDKKFGTHIAQRGLKKKL